MWWPLHLELSPGQSLIQGNFIGGVDICSNLRPRSLGGKSPLRQEGPGYNPWKNI